MVKIHQLKTVLLQGIEITYFLGVRILEDITSQPDSYR